MAAGKVRAQRATPRRPAACDSLSYIPPPAAAGRGCPRLTAPRSHLTARTLTPSRQPCRRGCSRTPARCSARTPSSSGVPGRPTWASWPRRSSSAACWRCCRPPSARRWTRPPTRWGLLVARGRVFAHGLCWRCVWAAAWDPCRTCVQLCTCSTSLFPTPACLASNSPGRPAPPPAAPPTVRLQLRLLLLPAGLPQRHRATLCNLGGL